MLTTDSPLSHSRLADHCAMCHAAVALLDTGRARDLGPALLAMAITHQLNDREREAFYRRLVDSLRRP